MLTVDSLVYEAVQRTFRNGIVGLLRVNLTETFGPAVADALRKPFTQEEWDRIVANAELPVVTGRTSREHPDDFEYLSVNHFFNLFDMYFDDLVPPDELPSADFMPKMKKQLLDYFKEVKDIRDPISHPPTEELPIDDALRTVDSCMRILRVLHLEDALSETSQLWTELIARAARTAPPEILSPLDDTLPPSEAIVTDFVGRTKELASLWAWLVDPSARRWLLSGDGGKGKSAIAFKFATDVRIAAPESLAGVFWLAAKRRRFEEGAIVDIPSPDFWDLDSALNKILLDYGDRDAIDQSTQAKRITALGLLEQVPVLIIADDLDSIQPEAEDVVEFLTLDVPRAGSKVLVTSRRLFAGLGATSTVVEGLGEAEAKEFIDSRLARMGLNPADFNVAVKKQVFNVCEGSPLYMEDLLRLFNYLSAEEAIASWTKRSGDAARSYALDRELEMLSSVAKEILQACSLSRAPTSLVELQRILGRDEEAVLAAVDELRRMYLVPSPQLIEGVPRFQVNRNLGALIRASLEGTSEKLELEGAIRAVAGKEPGRVQAGAIGDYARQARVLVNARRWREAEETLLTGLESFPNNPKLLGILGWVYKKWYPRRLTDARETWERAYDLGSKDIAMYLNWSTMESEEGNWERGAQAAERGLDRAGEHASLLQQAGYCRSRLGQALVQALQEEKGATELHRADSFFKKALSAAVRDNLDRREISRAHRGLVINAQAMRNRQALCARLLAWLTWDRSDPVALAELERQVGKCPDVEQFMRTY
jgi:hypothetical protein